MLILQILFTTCLKISELPILFVKKNTPYFLTFLLTRTILGIIFHHSNSGLNSSGSIVALGDRFSFGKVIVNSVLSFFNSKVINEVQTYYNFHIEALNSFIFALNPNKFFRGN